jgi:acetyl-CoA C-acetyltransferase
MMHPIAGAFGRLGRSVDRTLLTGVGMHMAKHVAAVWSSTPGAEGLSTALAQHTLQSEVEADQPRRDLLTGWTGPATVCAYTVAHGRDGGAEQGLVVLDTEAGRALARVYDPDLLADAESAELVGRVVSVTTDGNRNEARW